jgi:hypothetical protein
MLVTLLGRSQLQVPFSLGEDFAPPYQDDQQLLLGGILLSLNLHEYTNQAGRER